MESELEENIVSKAEDIVESELDEPCRTEEDTARDEDMESATEEIPMDEDDS